MVEFALVAPLFMALFVGLADVGRGLLAYTELAMGSRAAARQAVLQYNASSNTASSGCTSPCSAPGVVPIIRQEAGLGFPVVYSDSANQTSPPSYGTATADTSYTAGSAYPPYDLALASGALSSSNTIYVFVYQYDPTASRNARWACGTACTGTAARTSGHLMAVVDEKVRWTSITLSLLGLSPSIVLDSQTVQRCEY